MDKRKFAQDVCSIINMKGYETDIIDSSRNNGAFIGVLVKTRKDGKVSPIFNINGQETLTPEEYADQILSTIPSDIDADAVSEIMKNKYEVINRCHYILVNSEMNASRETLLRRPINRTLELQFKVDIDDVVPGGKVPLEIKHLKQLGLTENDIYNMSWLNTMEKYPARFVNLREMLPLGIEEDLPMYVLSNTTNYYGAGVVLYEGMKRKLEDTVGDFIVIPSSVHETLIIPNSLGEIDAITTMIREVNETVVRPDEVLSDRPYELISDGVLFEM